MTDPLDQSRPWTLRIDSSALDTAIQALRSEDDSGRGPIAFAHPEVIRSNDGSNYGIMVVREFELGGADRLLHESGGGVRVVLLPEIMFPRIPIDALTLLRAKSPSVSADSHALQVELFLEPEGRGGIRVATWDKAGRLLDGDIAVCTVGHGLRWIPTVASVYGESRSLQHVESEFRFPRTRRAFPTLRSWNSWRNLRTLVAGCGRSGSILVDALVTQGIRNLVLVDHDRVEVGNLDGMAHVADEDVGRMKVEAVADALRRRFRDTRVVALPVPLESEEVVDHIMHADVIFTTTDHAAPRLRANYFARRFMLVHIDVGTDTNRRTGESGADVRLFLPSDQHACILCLGGVAPGPVPGRMPTPESLRDWLIAMQREPGTSTRAINAFAAHAATDMLRRLVIGELAASRWERTEVNRDGLVRGEEISSPRIEGCPWCGVP